MIILLSLLIPTSFLAFSFSGQSVLKWEARGAALIKQSLSKVWEPEKTLQIPGVEVNTAVERMGGIALEPPPNRRSSGSTGTEERHCGTEETGYAVSASRTLEAVSVFGPKWARCASVSASTRA